MLIDSIAYDNKMQRIINSIGRIKVKISVFRVSRKLFRKSKINVQIKDNQILQINFKMY